MSGHAPPVAWPPPSDDRSRRFRFALLGGPLLTLDGEEIPLSPYQMLLSLLVFGHGDRGLPRARAARYLWGTELDSGARHRLSQLLHAIKQRTGGNEVVFRRGERLLPNPAVAEWDTLASGDGEEGAPQELLPLLPTDLPTRDLEEWVHGLRVTHQRRREAVLQSLPAGPAVPTVRESDLVRSVAPQRGTSSLVGRRSELASALAAISGEPPRWTTVVVSGEAGIGKTRLLGAIQEALAVRGRETTFIRCHEAERLIAFNLLADLWTNPSFASASEALPDPWREILRTTFPGMSGAGAGAGTGAGRRDVSPTTGSPPLPRRVFDAIERGFALAVPAEGLDILIDDFHWSDPGSAAALGFLRRRLPDLGVRIVLTVPSHAAPLDHPASAYLRALDGGRDHWITLEPLAGDEIGWLIESSHPKTMSDQEIREISTLSGGVPLFAVELARDRSARSGASPSVPTTTRSAEALFRRRQAALSPAAEHVLRLLAVFRRPVPRGVLEAASGLDPDGFGAAAEELTRQRLVAVDGDGPLSTRHEMLRGAVYQALPPEARRMYHRTVAECLLGCGVPAEPGEIARHFQRGRAPLLAHRFATVAADEAARKGAFQECRQMLELAAATASDPTRRFESLHRLGRLCLLQSQPGAAATHLLAAEKSAKFVGDIAHALDARIRAIGALLEIGERTGPSLQEELGELASTSLGHGYLATYLDAKDLSIRVADYGFDAPAARAALADVDRLDVDGEAPPVRCLRETIRTRHICYGSPDEAVLAARRALRIARDHDLATEFGRAVKRFLVVLGYRGMLDGDEGRRLVEEAKIGFQRSGNQSGLFDVLINLGVWLVDTGRYPEAEKYLAEAGRIVQSLEDSPEHGVFMCNMGEFYLYQADYLTAKRYFLRAWERGVLTRRATRCAVAGGLGLCSVQTGDLSLAGDLDRTLPDDASFLGNPTVDPTPVALFRARRLEVKQSPEAAARLLHLYGESLRERIVPAWMKVLLAELRLRRKHNLGGVGDLAEEGREAAGRLGLVVREREFAAYAS